MYRCLLCVTLLGAALGACAPAPAPPVEGADLDALVDEYIEIAGRRGGVWSTAALATGGPDLSPERFARDLDPRRDLLARVQAVPTEGLTLPQQTDRTTMIALLESDIYDEERRRAWATQPTLYVPAGAIAGLFPEEGLGLEIDAERATGLLGALPVALEQARSQLERPAERFTREAIFQTSSTIDVLRAGRERLDGAAAAAADDALRALESHLEFLQTELLPRSDGSWAIGKEHYDYTLQHRWLMREDADDIIAMGRAEFDRIVAEAQEVAERIEPGRHWAEVYDALKRDHPTADGLKQAYQEQMDAARDFVYARQVLTLPQGEHVITVDTPPAQRRSSPFGTFDSVGPEDDHLEGRLVLTPIEEGLSPEQREARLSAHHTAWIPIIAVHEAYPGHHAQALKVLENPRRLRHYVRESIFSEGWGLFTEQLMFELGFLQGDDVKLTQLRNRLWRAARVILDASLHTDRMTFDEAVQFMVDEVRFDPIAAELEVGMYTGRPTYFLGYLIGSIKIEEMRNDWIATFGEPDEPRELWDRLLTIGSLPPSLVRAELFAE